MKQSMDPSRTPGTPLPFDADSDPSLAHSKAPQVEVRGHSIYQKEASALLLTAVRLLDLSLAFLSFTLLLGSVSLGSHPRLWWIGGIGLVFLLQSALFIGTLGRTAGGFFWSVKRESRRGFPGSRTLLQADKISREIILTGILGTVGSLLAAGLFSSSLLFSFPIWQKAEIAFFNSSFPSSSSWTPLPFFYTLGAWPTQFKGMPVLYRLPYEKGPPSRFVGHLSLRWSSPSIEVLIEGPKTPSDGYSREEIRNCLVSTRPLFCLGLREKILSRHTDELGRGQNTGRAASSVGWKLKWFTIKNPALAPQEQLQGFSIKATQDGFSRERYVLITPKGVHQSFTLIAPQSGEGGDAAEIFEKAMRSLRVSDELTSGTAWIDRRLEDTRLEDLNQVKEPLELIHKYTEIQALLLAKITVDPKTYDSYFHLAGISLTLAKYLERLQQNPQPLSSPGLENLPLAELLSSTSGLIDSAYHYALDVNPAEPRNAKIKNYLEQAGKIQR